MGRIVKLDKMVGVKVNTDYDTLSDTERQELLNKAIENTQKGGISEGLKEGYGFSVPTDIRVDIALVGAEVEILDFAEVLKVAGDIIAKENTGTNMDKVLIMGANSMANSVKNIINNKFKAK